MATKLEIEHNNTRVGVVTFSYHAEVSIELGDHSDPDSFGDAVDRIPLMGSITRMDKALRVAQWRLLSTENGGRGDAAKVLILITDGSQTYVEDMENPIHVADEIRDQGILI